MKMKMGIATLARLLPVVAVLCCTRSLLAGQGAPSPLRVYYIGNSVTDTIRYGPFAELAASRGVKITWGRHMIPGAPLEWIYTHPDDGFQEEPYGRWRKALNEFAWDAVSLQPFDRHLHSKDDKGEEVGDVELIVKLARMAAAKNPDVQVYIYARWPRVTVAGKGVPFDKNDYDPAKPGSGNDLSNVDDYTARWESKYTGGWDNTNETRDYFETVLSEVRKATPFLKKPVRLVPVGHVLAELHTQMKAGKISGWTSIYQFYKDGIHLNEPGSYAVACTYFATLLRQSPEGLPTQPYGKIDAELAKIIQQTAWRVVRSVPEALPGVDRQSAQPSQAAEVSAICRYERREVEGWTVHIRAELIETNPTPTARALQLLQEQLKEIARVAPAAAVVELRKVPLYFSPEYPGERPRAEYHPDVGWLREHGRDPAMARAVEFSNVRQFEVEMNRMPNFALHELAHAYHHRVLPEGFGNPDIKAAYERARASGKYDRVERRLGNGRPNTFERAYAMTDAMEYFAETTEAYFSRNDFFPFTRAELEAHDPEMFALLGRLWGAQVAAAGEAGSEAGANPVRPGGLMADSPVTFPKEGALPARYPPDVRERSEPAEKDYFLFSSPCRSLKQIAAIQKDMPPGQFASPPADWVYLQRTRRILNEGGELRLLALGDSIVNDTMRSGWVALLQEAYPKARIEATVYVRGGGGCQHYREEDRVAKYILPRKPDLVLIGGISQRDIESIREVIRQLRAGLPNVEILLATGAFGTVDPRDPAALARASYSGSGEYGATLKSLAAEQHCAYLDMTTPWAEYLRSAKVHPHLFYRDVVHANEFGEQVLAKTLMAFWTTPRVNMANESPATP